MILEDVWADRDNSQGIFFLGYEVQFKIVFAHTIISFRQDQLLRPRCKKRFSGQRKKPKGNGLFYGQEDGGGRKVGVILCLKT